MSKPSGGVQAHKHCPVCGVSIPTSKNYCTPEHEEMNVNNQKKMKSYRTLTLLLMVAAMVALVGVSLYLRARG